MALENPHSIDSLVVLDDDWFAQFEGPFSFTRDGGRWELLLPIEGDGVTISESQAASIELSTNRTALAIVAGEVIAHGPIEVVDYPDGEDALVVGVDSSQYVDPSEYDVEGI